MRRSLLFVSNGTHRYSLKNPKQKPSHEEPASGSTDSRAVVEVSSLGD
jgi:hypothetical protein